MPDDGQGVDTQTVIDYIHSHFPEAEWATASAIVLRESGFNPTAINNTSRPDLPGYHAPGPGTSPEYSIGLFQINTNAWPQIAQQFDLTDPLSNIQAAALIYQQYGWLPWGGVPGYASPNTTTSQGPLPTPATSSAATTTTPATQYSASNPLAGLAQVGAFFQRLNDFLAYIQVNVALAFARIIITIIGVLVTLAGLYFLMKSLGD